MIPSARPRIEPAVPPMLLQQRFRASPDYRLVAHADLPEEDRRHFAPLAEDPEHFGLLVPVSCVQSGVKAVGAELARLFGALSRPGALPPEVVRAPHPRLNARLAGLVLDGVLEVELDGAFASGPAAGPLLAGPGSPAARAHPLSALSRAALRLAWSVPTEDPAQLSGWIYGFNAVPLGPAWLRRLGSAERWLELIGLHDGGRNHRRVASGYHETPHPAWHGWTRRTGAPGAAQHLGYKLYVSPHPRVLVEAFDGVLDVLLAEQVPAFKLGKGPAGVLRPDKLVVYLDGWESLHALALRLEAALAGVPAQGVPFTAPLSEDALLSWGMDPPPHARLRGYGPIESWRLWLSNQLARAVLHARSRGADADQALAYASTRLRLEGVDTGLWIPEDALWAEEGVPA